MTDLVEFLWARYDEDEQAALRAREWWDSDREAGYFDWPSREASAHVQRHTPARVLREIEAKRRIIHAHARPHECISLTGKGERSVVDGQAWELWEPQHTDDHGPCFVLRCLALPYDWHDDYRQEWRP